MKSHPQRSEEILNSFKPFNEISKYADTITKGLMEKVIPII